jgi:ribosomal protein L11
VAPSKNVTVPVGVPPVLVTVVDSVTDCPYVDGFADDVGAAVVVVALFTVCDSAADVLVANDASPLYVAVMECVPTLRVDRASEAVPALSVAVPIEVAPSKNVTAPVGVPPVLVTVVESVTDCPDVDGFADDVGALVVVVALFTVCESAVADVLVANDALPLYVAVIECVPTDKLETASEAEPLLSVAVPIEVAPSKNVTVPVGVPPVLVTVVESVTDCPDVDGFADDVGVLVVVVALFTVCDNAADVLVANCALPL